MPRITELELIDGCKRGDAAAMTELFERHYASSLRVARRILRSEDESQDAVQSAYFSAFRRIARFRGEACFKTWITRIVVNCCLMRLREPWRRLRAAQTDEPGSRRQFEALPSPIPSPEQSAWRSEIASAHSRALAKLPRGLRDAYALYSISGLTLAEVAEELDLSVPAAKTRLFRARAGMRRLLGPVWEKPACSRSRAAV